MAAASRYLRVSLLSLLFLALLIFHKPLFHAGLGSFVKLIFWQKDLEFAYRAVEWKNKQMIFSNVVLKDKNEDTFQANIEQASLSLNWKEFPKKMKGRLTVDRPFVSIQKLKPGKNSGGWADFSIAIHEGTLEMPGMEKAHFSYEKMASDQWGRLILDWPGSRLAMDAFSEKDEIKISAELVQIPASLIQSLFGFWDSQFLSGWKLQEGILDGTVHGTLENGRLKKSSGRLEMKKISIDSPHLQWRASDFFCDWDGEIQAKEGFLGTLFTEYPRGRIRLSFNQAGLKADAGSIDQARGDFTFNSGIGCKWDFTGTGSSRDVQFPMAFEGSCFLHSQRVNWMESSLKFGGDRSGSISIHGKEEEGRQIWKAELETVRSEPVNLFHSLMSALLPESYFGSLDWDLQRGSASGKGDLILSEKGIEEWDFSKIKLEDISWTRGDWQVGCQKAEGQFSKQGGKWSLDAAFFQVPLVENQFLRGNDWEGECAWDQQTFIPSHFHGWTDLGLEKPLQTSLKISGPWSNWQAESDLAGFLTGHLQMRGKKEKNRWDFQIEKGEIEGLHFQGNGWVAPEGRFSLKIDRFEGSAGGLAKLWEGQFEGKVSSLENGFQIAGGSAGYDWSLDAKLEHGSVSFPLFPNWKIEEANLELLAASDEIAISRIDGRWVNSQGSLQFTCPLLMRKDSDWFFDFRFHDRAEKESVWDFMRLAGLFKGHTFSLDEERSHFLGVPMHFKECRLDSQGALAACDLHFNLPWEALLAAEPFLQKWGIPSFRQTSLSGSADIQFHYLREGQSEFSVLGKDLALHGKPLFFDFQALEKEKGEWRIERCFFSDFSLNGQIKKENGGYRIEKGEGKWKNGLAAQFEGKISSHLLCDFSLSNIRIDLSQACFLSSPFGLSLDQWQGILEGEGHFTYNGLVESDFDLISSDLKVGASYLENNGPIHLYFSSEKGIFFKGLDLQVFKSDSPSLGIGCKIDLLQYDLVRSHWILNHSRIHVPVDGFFLFKQHPSWSQLFSEKQELDILADFDCASDFSAFSCSMKEGFIPCGGTIWQVQNLRLDWDGGECKSHFQVLHKGHAIHLGLDINLGGTVCGTLKVWEEGILHSEDENPLKIDWEYLSDDRLLVHAIEGTFGGIDASFYEEADLDGNTLIGSVRVDFKTLSDFIPSEIGEVFQQLKMGKGYELKGRINLKGKQAYFNGLFSGKQLELFGYQFRTLLGKIDLGPDHVSITDLKVSDHAGVMKIDRISMECKQDSAPWTLSIPQLSLIEFRPSLLQKPEQEPGPISPLVIRELTLKDFKGILDDSKTYTAKGNLHFINSYKRETTVFDLPADVLSRIVGLDLELLIPVCGVLDFELADRHFKLTELKEAFSQSHRSEFFLEPDPEEGGPYMDLDGNLKILVKMKQFVLFKFTEAFLISIEGNLEDPQFRLQKKRRFFGI